MLHTISPRDRGPTIAADLELLSLQKEQTSRVVFEKFQELLHAELFDSVEKAINHAWAKT